MIYAIKLLYLVKNKERKKLKNKRLLFAIAVLFGLSGCASTSTPDDGALERYNRAMFSFNNKIDRFVVRPIAKGYKVVTNKYVRQRVSNFFNNIEEPVSALNHMLQGEFSSTGNNLGRFVLNTTLGVVGLYDVASSVGLDRDKASFDETLATWCVPDGPFVVLPIVGPSTPRSAIGFAVDGYSSPSYWIAHEAGDGDAMKMYYAATGLKYVNLMAENLSFIEGLEKDSLDYYSAVKSMYMQNRSKLPRCGNIKDVSLDYDFDMDDMGY